MNAKRIFISLTTVFIIGFFMVPYVNSALEKKLIVAVGQEPTSMDQSLIYAGGDYQVVDNWGEYPICRVPSGDLKPGLASWKVSPTGKR